MRFRNEALPQPVILPPDGLNFGKMRQGRRHSLAFQVGNTGGAAQKFSVNYDEQSSWFHVAKGERIYRINLSLWSLWLGSTPSIRTGADLFHLDRHRRG